MTGARERKRYTPGRGLYRKKEWVGLQRKKDWMGDHELLIKAAKNNNKMSNF